jgi:hypothetical protein
LVGGRVHYRYRGGLGLDKRIRAAVRAGERTLTGLS